MSENIIPEWLRISHHHKLQQELYPQSDVNKKKQKKKQKKNHRNSHQRCSIKKLFLKTSQYSQENTCVGVSLFANSWFWNQHTQEPLVKEPSPILEQHQTTELGCNTQVKQKLQKQKPKNNKQHQKSLNESHKSSRSRNKIFILGDNIIKHFQGWEISKNIKHVLNRSFLSAKVMYMKDSPNLA